MPESTGKSTECEDAAAFKRPGDGAVFERALVLLLLLMCALGGPLAPARADEPPPIDAKSRWRVMTLDDATTTSTCLGREPNPTPLCAVDNLRACYVRSDRHYCRIGRGLAELDRSDIYVEPSQHYYERYKVLIHRRLRPADMDYIRLESESDIARVGDTWILVLYGRCLLPVGGGGCSKGGHHLNYILRKDGPGWRAVNQFGPSKDWQYRKKPPRH